MKRYLMIYLLILGAGACSRPFDRLSRGLSKASPKQQLIAQIIPPATFIGHLASPVEVASPLIVNDRVYLASVHNAILAVRKKSGKILWKKKIPGGVESTPAYYNQRLYFGANDGFFYCVETDSGKTIWRYNTQTAIYSTPLLKGEYVYFLTSKNALYALKSDTGKRIWRFNKGYLQKISMRGSASPVYHDGKIYIGLSDGAFYAVNAFDGREVWFRRLSPNEKFTDIDATPIVLPDKLFVGTSDGFMYALNPVTGATLWQRQYNAILGITADHRRIYLSMYGEVSALSQKNGIKAWTYVVEEGVPSKPLLVEDQLIFGTTTSHVYSLSSQEGSEIWRYNTDSGLSSRPTFHSDSVYLFTHFSKLHVIDPFYLISAGE